MATPPEQPRDHWRSYSPGIPGGATEATLFAHGFWRECWQDLFSQDSQQ